MVAEAMEAERTALSGRAGVAMLTLQLNALRNDIANAEAEDAAWDLDDVLARMRSKLEPLVEDRRRTLDAELAEVRAGAARAIAVAHEQAAVIRAEAEALPFQAPVPSSDAASPAARLPLAGPAPFAPPLAAPPSRGLPVEEVPGSVIARVPPSVESLLGGLRSNSTAPAIPAAPIRVMIDHEAFAQAIASAIAAVMDARPATSFAPTGGPYVQQPAPAIVKKSFWAAVWHADVILSLIAMMAVLVVLLAWST